MQKNDVILEFKNVSFKWENGLELKNISLKIERGSFVLISGQSGSGKSTLLRLASLLEEFYSGEILLEGQNYLKILPELIRKKVSLIQQTPSIIDGSVKANLLLPFSFAINKELARPSDEFLEKELKKFALEDIPLNKDANSLSVGQKQRVCILRTMLLNPQVLLMDEPTSALDKKSREIVENISEELNKAGVTIVMVSHSDYRPKVAHKLVVFNKGKIENIIDGGL